MHQDFSPLVLADLFREDAVIDRLTERGLALSAAHRLAPRFVRVAYELREHGTSADDPAHAFFVPGRIEVLGKHTDYAGGSSLTCAVERGFSLVAVPRAGRTLRIHHVAAGEDVEAELAPGVEPPAGHWANYPLTVVRRVARDFEGPFRGGQIAFSSNLPQAAGMSSSSAMVVAFFLALSALNELTDRPAYRKHLSRRTALAQYLGAVESGQAFGPFGGDTGVGTFGGSEDHTAILCAAPGALRRFRYRPIRFEEAVPCPEGHVFVIAASGVTAEKTGAAREAYNRASVLADRTAQAWRSATGRDDPHLGAAIRADAFTPERMREALRTACDHFEAEALIRRFEHFYTENHQILPAAVEALKAGDLDTFGAWVDRSQQAAETMLGNQVPETIFLAQSARQRGAVAASSFGAGFGGAVWALVAADEAPQFRDDWALTYAEQFPDPARQATFLIEQPGPAAFSL